MSGDYAIGLLTIITGLAIADVVTSLHTLLINRKRVQWDWLTLLAALFIVLLIIAIWSISYRDAGSRNFNPPLWEFAGRLFQIVPMYLAARAILPDEVGKDGVSLAAHYADVSRYFWGSIALTYALYLGFLLIEGGTRGLMASNLSPAVQLVLMSILIAVPRRAVHMVLVPICFALLCFNHLFHPMFG